LNSTSGTQAVAAPGPAPALPPPPAAPPPIKHVILIFAWLLISTTGLLWGARYSVGQVQDVLQAETRIHVGNLGALPLERAPARFRYDRHRGELVFLGFIDDDAKQALVAAVSSTPPQLAPQRSVYLVGVERLAFDSAERSDSLVLMLLLLGGMAGTLGVQLRSIANFVGHTCYKRDLDVPTWWPYYFIRPMTGFLLGCVLVGIVQSGLFTVENSSASKVMWWAALAFLAGFGEDEFTQRLRSVSQTIFGVRS